MNTNVVPTAKQLIMKQIKVVNPDKRIPVGTYDAYLRSFVIKGEHKKLILKLCFEVVDDPFNQFFIYSDVVVEVAENNIYDLDTHTLDRAIYFLSGEASRNQQQYSYKLHEDRLIHLSKLIDHLCKIEVTYSAHIHEDASLIGTDTRRKN